MTRANAILATVLIVLVFLVLTGCSTPRPQIHTVQVPVPVSCQQTVPDRPQMPTEQLQPGAGLDDYVKASQAEIERREGYEGRLRAALVACVQALPDAAQP